MKVGIILHPYGENKPAGLGGYILELARNLVEMDKGNEYTIFVKGKSGTEILDSRLRGNDREKKINYWVLGFGPLWRDLGLWLAPKADVYIFNTPVMPLFFRPKKSIVIALDFAYLYFKPRSLGEWLNNFILSRLNKFSLKKADKIVAISEATKNDVIKFFGISAEKITVIYPGFRDIGEIETKELQISKPFFLYVGVIKERKNALNVVRGFIEFKKKIPLNPPFSKGEMPFKLVIAGKGDGDYWQKIIDLVKQEKMESEIIFPDYVDMNQLAWLYKNTTALVFPSLIEGFGFPLLEAMSAGAPVITSKISSLGEVAGDAALLVDPLNIHEISEAMHKIATNSSLREELIKKGKEKINYFSWTKCAVEFIKLL